MYNILKGYMYTEEVIRVYLNLLLLYQYIYQKVLIYVDAMTMVYCVLLHLLNTVLNLLNVPHLHGPYTARVS